MEMRANGKAKIAECVATQQRKYAGVAEPFGLRLGRKGGDIRRGDDEGDGHYAGDEAGDNEAKKDAQQRDHRPTRSGVLRHQAYRPQVAYLNEKRRFCLTA